MLFPVFTHVYKEEIAASIMERQGLAPVIPKIQMPIVTKENGHLLAHIEEVPLFVGMLFSIYKSSNASDSHSINTNKFFGPIIRLGFPCAVQNEYFVPKEIIAQFDQPIDLSIMPIKENVHNNHHISEIKRTDEAIARVFFEKDKIKKLIIRAKEAKKYGYIMPKTKYPDEMVDRILELEEVRDNTPTPSTSRSIERVRLREMEEKRKSYFRFDVFVRVKDDIPVLPFLRGKAGMIIKIHAYHYTIHFDDVKLTENVTIPIRMLIRSEYVTPIL
jgi:hypothetical protein